MSEEIAVSVAMLWEHLQAMEEQRRFNGQAYPAGMSCFPFRLTGQGFFPGGDGLWRDDIKISDPSDGLVRPKGIMFLGNDFGTCKTYERLRKNGYENPPTWRHIKQRAVRAGLDPSLTFFTNAVMGLRNEGSALDRKDWDAVPIFRDYCREFLTYQIEALQPKLIVVMGPVPRSTLDSLAVGSVVAPGKFPRIQFGSHGSTIFYCTHPYGDVNFDEARKMRDGIELRDAWAWAQQE